MTVIRSSAHAAKTPSGPPPIPKNISTLYFGSETYNAPSTSPSVISLMFTFKSLSLSIIFLCLGLSKIQTVIEENLYF